MPAFSAVATCFGCSAYRFRRFGKDKAFDPVFGGGVFSDYVCDEAVSRGPGGENSGFAVPLPVKTV